MSPTYTTHHHHPPSLLLPHVHSDRLVPQARPTTMQQPQARWRTSSPLLGVALLFLLHLTALHAFFLAPPPALSPLQRASLTSSSSRYTRTKGVSYAMMDGITNGLIGALKSLAGQKTISEANIGARVLTPPPSHPPSPSPSPRTHLTHPKHHTKSDGALRDVKRALLDADVNLKVTNALLEAVKEKALGRYRVGGWVGSKRVPVGRIKSH